MIGEPEWKTDPNFAKPEARLPRLNQIFDRIEAWTMTKTKFEAMDILNEFDIPCGPILSMKETRRGQVPARDRHGRRGRSSRARQISDGRQSDQALGQPERGERSPLLGEHTEEILRDVLGYNDSEVAGIRGSGATELAPKRAAAGIRRVETNETRLKFDL